MGLTVDFSMGFVCFDAASKVGVQHSSVSSRQSDKPEPPWCTDYPQFPASLILHSVPFWECSFQTFQFSLQTVLAVPQVRAPCRLLQQHTLLEGTGRKRCHIVPRFWPRFLKASVFLKDATRAARVLFSQRNAQTRIHMLSATAGYALFERLLNIYINGELLLADFKPC